MQRGSNGHSAGIRAAAAQGRDVVHLVQALKASHHHHTVAVQLVFNALGVQALNAGLGVGLVRAEARLPARQADGRSAHALQCHRQQRNADLLTGGQQHIHLAARRVVGDLCRFGQQVIGGIALGRHHHHHIVARIVGVAYNARHVENTVTVGNR